MIGERLMLGIRGSVPGDSELEHDLSACADVGVKAVILFDKDIESGGDRNIHDLDQVRRLIEHVRIHLGEDTVIAIDQEGGKVQRLGPAHGGVAHPSAHELAQMTTEDRRAAVRVLASELARVGVNLNLGPCVDVGESSPVIGGLGRSFGDDPEHVITCARDVIEVHAECGVGGVLKHFPGHGSAATDSHLVLPDITETFDAERELKPYRALYRHAAAVMTAHVLHLGLDPQHPASLSERVIRGMLRKKIGFEGIVVTDSLDMEGVRASSLSEVIAAAARAGNDLIVHACNSSRGEYAPEVIDAAAKVSDHLEADVKPFERLWSWRKELMR